MSRQPASEKFGDSARNEGKKAPKKRVPPPSLGRSPNVARIDKGAEYRHTDLIPGGLAKPGQEAANILKYGYESVKDHFVNGPADLPASALARVWNVNRSTLENWIRDGQWVKARDERLAETPVLLGGLKPDDVLTVAREKYLAQESAVMDIILGNIKADAEEKYEDVMSPQGDLNKVKKRAATRRYEAQTAKMMFDHARMALGLRSKPGLFEGAKIDARTVNMIVESRPSQSDTDIYLDETLKELMPPEEMEDEIEGEVVD